MSMVMSFFNHALTKTSREAASQQCTRTMFLKDNDELLVHMVWSGTLRPPVRGHDVKKDITMLMRITNDTSVALTKGKGEFSKS